MGVVSAHEEFKEKTWELEAGWITEENNYEYRPIEWEVR